MYSLNKKIVKSRKLVGYVVVDDIGTSIRLRLDEAHKLIASNMVRNAVLCNNGTIKGNGVDLRTLGTINLDREYKENACIGKVTNMAVRTTDYDSDLADAEYKTEDGRVYLLGCDLRIACKSDEHIRRIYTLINEIDFELSRSVQNYNDYKDKDKYILELKILHYKPSHIFKFIKKLAKQADVKVLMGDTVDFKQHKLKVDFDNKKLYKNTSDNETISIVDYKVAQGLLYQYSRILR